MAETAQFPTAGLKISQSGSSWCGRDSPERTQAMEMWERLVQWIQSHHHCQTPHRNDCPVLKMLLLCRHTLPTASGAQHSYAHSNNFSIFHVYQSTEWLPFQPSFFAPVSLSITQHVDSWTLHIPRALTPSPGQPSNWMLSISKPFHMIWYMPTTHRSNRFLRQQHW